MRTSTTTTTAPTTTEVLRDPRKLRTIEQLLIDAFGGKAELVNKINASRKLFCD